jgi:hypothetical protein
MTGAILSGPHSPDVTKVQNPAPKAREPSTGSHAIAALPVVGFEARPLLLGCESMAPVESFVPLERIEYLIK